MTPSSFVARLTPPGQGAIATLGLVGPLAWEVLCRLFIPRSGQPLPARPMVGRFMLGSLGQDLADEAVLIVKRIEPQAWLELHTHGGRQVVDWLLELFAAHGFQCCDWIEFQRRAGGDRLQVQAVGALTQAQTVQTARVLLDQYHGAFAFALDALDAALQRGNLETAQSLTAGLASRENLGRHLTAPWRVVIAGAPNVGKSSLVNALAGFQRSVVDAAPGTTRDLVTTTLALNGWLVELIDTAGQRLDAGPLESAGIRLAQDVAANADLCLWVVDTRTDPALPSAEFRLAGCHAFAAAHPLQETPTPPTDRESMLPPPSPMDSGMAAQKLCPQTRLLINKIDLTPTWDLSSVTALRVSATTGAGLPQLAQALAVWLVPAPPPPGAAVPFTAGLCDAVLKARELLAQRQVAQARRLVAAMRAGDIP